MRRRTAAAAILLLAGSLSACAAAPATPTPRLVSVPTPAWQTSTIPATAAPVASVQTGSLSAVRLPAPAQRLVPPSISVPAGLRHQLEGIASYYWQDQMTASGEKFDKKAMTAAHKTLPLGKIGRAHV